MTTKILQTSIENVLEIMYSSYDDKRKEFNTEENNEILE